MKHPPKFITFQWLITHNSVPVGAWCEVMGHPSACNICHNEQETQAHALWSCDAAHQIWGRILRRITKTFPQTQLTWVCSVWYILGGPPSIYIDLTRIGYRLDGPQPRSSTISSHYDTMKIRYDERRNLINACTLWHIWRRRCTTCFDNFVEPAVETIKAIWCDLLHTLKGQFDSIQGESNRANKEQHAFYKL